MNFCQTCCIVCQPIEEAFLHEHCSDPLCWEESLGSAEYFLQIELLDLLYALELVGTDADRCKGLELVYGREWVVALNVKTASASAHM